MMPYVSDRVSYLKMIRLWFLENLLKTVSHQITTPRQVTLNGQVLGHPGIDWAKKLENEKELYYYYYDVSNDWTDLMVT